MSGGICEQNFHLFLIKMYKRGNIKADKERRSWGSRWQAQNSTNARFTDLRELLEKCGCKAGVKCIRRIGQRTGYHADVP